MLTSSPFGLVIQGHLASVVVGIIMWGHLRHGWLYIFVPSFFHGCNPGEGSKYKSWGATEKEREMVGEPSWLIETELTYRKSLSHRWAECVSLLISFTDKIHRLPSYLTISLVSSLCFSLPHFNHTLPCPSLRALYICQHR